MNMYISRQVIALITTILVVVFFLCVQLDSWEWRDAVCWSVLGAGSSLWATICTCEVKSHRARIHRKDIR